MTDTFRDNGTAGRFELDVGGRQAFAIYRRDGDRLVIDHVEAEPALRGTGAAGRLMEQVVAAARAENRTIVPRCGYAASWLRRHQG
ncbi:MAG: GNAT family N-acetyltransferase [Phreatobacter sp.]|jgi:predicted GNAT family acetyltransferase|uniref:GNAT family N-acetyltransferase n=1 Tax=Phreatobacter sp. TaxID=1966341 RepID=UPI00403702E8